MADIRPQDPTLSPTTQIELGAYRRSWNLGVWFPPTTPGGSNGGVGLAPYAEGATTIRLPLSSTLSLGMSAQADLGSGLALVLRPDSDPGCAPTLINHKLVAALLAQK